LRRLLRENWYRDVWLLAITLLVLLTVHDLHNEGKSRRDQSCTLFERTHNQDVSQVYATYHYLSGLRAADARHDLNPEILANVPKIESDALASRPPNYCAPVSVGLREQLTLPARPAFAVPVPPPPRGWPR